MDTYVFSPCSTTRACAQAIVRGMGEHERFIDLSDPTVSPEVPADTVMVAFPVYGGHMPPVVVERLDAVWAEDVECAGKRAIVVAVYGNRSYDNALLEADEYLTGRGFTCIAFATGIGQHSLCAKIASNRPDANDIALLEGFGASIAERAASEGTASGYATVEDLQPFANGPAPITDDTCTACGLCAASCPTQVIEIEDVAVSPNECLGCARCISVCPIGARHFPAEVAAMFEGFLNKVASERREPELFL